MDEKPQTVGDALDSMGREMSGAAEREALHNRRSPQKGAVLAAIVAIIVIIVGVSIILHIVLGTYYFFKKKDTAHTEYTSTLDDITEVDREMSKDKP